MLFTAVIYDRSKIACNVHSSSSTVAIVKYASFIMHIDRANMHSQGIACTISIDIGSTSAESYSVLNEHEYYLYKNFEILVKF